MPNMQEQLESNHFYHVYNKAVGNEKLFPRMNDYILFMEKYKYYISPISDTFAWCLIPNHFHFLIRIKDEKEITKQIQMRVPNPHKNMEIDVGKVIICQFSHFFNSYAQAYNKHYDRCGSLFKNRFKRKRITDDNYLKQLILYIHCNPIKHKICDNINYWQFSSFPDFMNRTTDLIKLNEVLGWFDDLNNFVYCHKNSVELKLEYALEHE